MIGPYIDAVNGPERTRPPGSGGGTVLLLHFLLSARLTSPLHPRTRSTPYTPPHPSLSPRRGRGIQSYSSLGRVGVRRVFGHSPRPPPIFSLRLHLGQMRERLRDLLGGVLVVLELAGQIGLVGAQVEEAVAAQVEDDGLLLALLLALERLVDGAADGVQEGGQEIGRASCR